MCGIAGFHLSFSPEKKVELLHAITQRLHHRGPDASGTYLDDNICLAHTRLKIIDLSDDANQPFSYEDDRIVLVFNGEIYNYASLRTELLQQGYHFRTKSDTEVVAAAYACWGISCLEKLDGLFALGIYDRLQKKVILARDVFGKKPLYYSRKGGLSFASELSVFTLLYPDLALEPAAINHYLSLGYILHPLTPYQNVFLLPPASYAEYDLTTSSFSTSSYFSYADCFRNKVVADTTAIIDSTLSLLNEAVSKRLIGDVPYGIFLSGGLDSSGIAAICRKSLQKDVPCYTAGFAAAAYDESAVAASTAAHLGNTHHKISLDSVDEHQIRHFINQFDYIPADNSALPIYHISQRAVQDVKFVLTGDGGDEIFGGYPTYRADRIGRKIKLLIPFLKRSGISNLIIALLKNSNDKVGPRTKAYRFFNGLDTDEKVSHYNWRLIFDPEERVSIMGSDYRELVYDTDPLRQFLKKYAEVSDLDMTDQHLYVDALTWLTDNNLIKLDRSTMAHGLEARSPLLDMALCSYVAGCPVKLKRDKHLLKMALHDLLPATLINKPKTGFNAPVAKWLDIREDEFKYYTRMLYECQFIGNRGK